MKHKALLLFVFVGYAQAGGPVAPDGWDGSFAPSLPNGADCCLPGDLNGTGLVGGAIVLLSADKKEFGLFALTYTPPLTEQWQLLESHPISSLASFRFSLVKSGAFPHQGIQACTGPERCTFYFTSGPGVPLERANEALERPRGAAG